MLRETAVRAWEEQKLVEEMRAAEQRRANAEQTRNAALRAFGANLLDGAVYDNWRVTVDGLVLEYWPVSKSFQLVGRCACGEEAIGNTCVSDLISLGRALEKVSSGFVCDRCRSRMTCEQEEQDE